MRTRRNIAGQSPRRALVALGVVLFLVLQALVSPLVLSSSRHAPGKAPELTKIVAGEICHDDASDPAGKLRHDHGSCCILCGSALRDLTLAFVVAWTATTLAPQRSEALATDYPVFSEAPPRAIGWASSWSSRAPPSFS